MWWKRHETAESGRLRLPLKCGRCGCKHDEDVNQIMLHPDYLNGGADWDCVLLDKIIVCPDCGAEDDYALNWRADRILKRELDAAALERRTDDPSSRLFLGEARLWDGTKVRRQSEALRHLEELTKQHCSSGEAWRRLANTEHRLGRTDLAVEHYRKAYEVDEEEVEAALSLAQVLWRQQRLEGIGDALITFLERLPQAPVSMVDRRQMSAEFVELLIETLEADDTPLALSAAWLNPLAKPKPIMTFSSVDLRRISRWDGLVDVLCDPLLAKVWLTSDLPTTQNTILEMRIQQEDIGPLEYIEASPFPRSSRTKKKQSKQQSKRKKKIGKQSRKKNRR